MVSEDIISAVRKALVQLDFPADMVPLQTPTLKEHGDYATSVALALAKKIGRKPYDLATDVTQTIEKEKYDFLERIEVVKPGFINFFVSKKYLLDTLLDIRTKGEEYGQLQKKRKDVVFIEHSQPNTNKPLHIGHLRNAVLGMSLVHSFRAVYETVESTNINNDRGIANIKGMWAYLFYGEELKASYEPERAKRMEWRKTLQSWSADGKGWKTPDSEEFERRGKGDYFVGKFYVVADGMGEDVRVGEKVQKDWTEMLKAWENDADPDHDRIFALWERLNAWFYEGSRLTMNRLGVRFTLPEEYESALYKKGKEHIEKAVKKGIPSIVRLDDGAIQAKLLGYNLPDKILVRRDGTAIYMTFDVELTRKRVRQLGMDKGIWVVGADQELYFKQLFAVCELLSLAPADKLHHFSYGMVRLKSGKLSSRKGRVIYADDVLDVAVEAARKLVDENASLNALSEDEKQEVAESVGVGAVKYAMLKLDPKSEILFDVGNSVSLQGNSGPYLQYTAVRTASVLVKSQESPESLRIEEGVEAGEPENAVLRILFKYPEVVAESVEKYAPHNICTYLYQLAQSYNAFYTSCPILTAEPQLRSLRLLLTYAVLHVMRNGLGLLGIRAPNVM